MLISGNLVPSKRCPHRQHVRFSANAIQRQMLTRVCLWAGQEHEPEKCTPRTKHRTKHCPQSPTEQNIQHNIRTNKLEQKQNRTQQTHRARFGTRLHCWQKPNLFHTSCRTRRPNNAEQRFGYTLISGFPFPICLVTCI